MAYHILRDSRKKSLVGIKGVKNSNVRLPDQHRTTAFSWKGKLLYKKGPVKLEGIPRVRIVAGALIDQGG